MHGQNGISVICTPRFRHGVMFLQRYVIINVSVWDYRKTSRYLDRQTTANSAAPDQKRMRRLIRFYTVYHSPSSCYTHQRGKIELIKILDYLNPGPAEPGYVLSLQKVQIQVSWLLKKPTDLDLHCLSFSIWICINNLDQISWLADN